MHSGEAGIQRCYVVDAALGRPLHLGKSLVASAGHLNWLQVDTRLGLQIPAQETQSRSGRCPALGIARAAADRLPQSCLRVGCCALMAHVPY